jgi:antitoxin YefM
VNRWQECVSAFLICLVGSRSLDFQVVGQYPVHVKSITYSAARENLASTIDRVCEDQAPVVITRNRDQAVVMLSLAEYESLQETAYLLRSPANARRLLAAVDTLKRGKGIERKIKLGA